QRAGGLRLGRAGLHLDQAHAAVAGDGEPLVVAEARDLLARELGHLQHVHAGLELDLDPVDLGDWHAVTPPRPWRRRRGPGARAIAFTRSASLSMTIMVPVPSPEPRACRSS